MVLDIFHEAQGAPLSSRQIGEALVVRQVLQATIVVTGIGDGTIAVQSFRLQVGGIR